MLEHQRPRCPATALSSAAPRSPNRAGWVAPRGDKHAALAESVGGQWVLKLCTETKAVPGSVVKQQVQAKLDAIEQQTGRRPRASRCAN
jgi:recombination associated protein RdgC